MRMRKNYFITFSNPSIGIHAEDICTFSFSVTFQYNLSERKFTHQNTVYIENMHFQSDELLSKNFVGFGIDFIISFVSLVFSRSSGMIQGVWMVKIKINGLTDWSYHEKSQKKIKWIHHHERWEMHEAMNTNLHQAVCYILKQKYHWKQATKPKKRHRFIAVQLSRIWHQRRLRAQQHLRSSGRTNSEDHLILKNWAAKLILYKGKCNLIEIKNSVILSIVVNFIF